MRKEVVQWLKATSSNLLSTALTISEMLSANQLTLLTHQSLSKQILCQVQPINSDIELKMCMDGLTSHPKLSLWQLLFQAGQMSLKHRSLTLMLELIGINRWALVEITFRFFTIWWIFFRTASMYKLVIQLKFSAKLVCLNYFKSHTHYSKAKKSKSSLLQSTSKATPLNQTFQSQLSLKSKTNPTNPKALSWSTKKTRAHGR